MYKNLHISPDITYVEKIERKKPIFLFVAFLHYFYNTQLKKGAAKNVSIQSRNFEIS